MPLVPTRKLLCSKGFEKLANLIRCFSFSDSFKVLIRPKATPTHPLGIGGTVVTKNYLITVS